MAIKVLQSGRTEGPQYRGQCRCCGQRIQCEQGDGEYVPHGPAPRQDEGDFVRVKCSCCCNEIVAYRFKGDQNAHSGSMPVQSIY